MLAATFASVFPRMTTWRVAFHALSDGAPSFAGLDSETVDAGQ